MLTLGLEDDPNATNNNAINLGGLRDNLGNHTAGQNLVLGSFGIDNGDTGLSGQVLQATGSGGTDWVHLANLIGNHDVTSTDGTISGVAQNSVLAAMDLEVNEANLRGIPAIALPDATSAAKGIVQLTNDFGGTATAPVVSGLQGTSVSTTAPATGQILKFDGSNWAPAAAPAADNLGNHIATADLNLGNNGINNGDLGTNGQVLSSTGTGTDWVSLGSVIPDATTSVKGILQLTNDLSGTAAAPVVSGLQGTSVSTTAPATGQILKFDGSNWAPAAAPAADNLGNHIATADLNLGNNGINNGDLGTNGQVLASTGTGTDWVSLGSITPDATSAVKGILQLTNDLSGTAAAPVVSGLQGTSVSTTAPATGQILKFDGSNWAPAAAPTADNLGNHIATADLNLGNNGINNGDLGTNGQLLSSTGTGTDWVSVSSVMPDATTSVKGMLQLTNDLGGTATAPLVTGLQGNAVATTTPTNGQVLTFNGTNWAPAAATGDNLGNHTAGQNLTMGSFGISDVNSQLGGNTQILSSTGTGVDWIDNTAPAAGTATHNTLRWNGTAWVESSALTNDDSKVTTTGDLQVGGAAYNDAAYNAGSTTTIDFSKSNLAYTSASPGSFTLNNLKNGATYTLAVQGTTAGTASFTAAGFTFKSTNNGATTAGKHTLYTFMVMGSTVYYTMHKGY